MGKVFPVLLAATALAAGSFHPDSFEMRRWVTLPLYGWHGFPAGDADHDGRIELYLSAPGTRYQMCIAEYAGDTLFDTTLIEHDELYPWLVCDVDRDGKMNLVAEAPQGSLQLFEARDSFSYPDSLVWLERIFFWGSPSVTDLDRDSLREITVTHLCAEDSLRIYEVVADDSLVVKARLGIGWPHLGKAVETHDLDRDGRPELLASGCESGLVVFFEAVGNDSFVCVAQCSLHNEAAIMEPVAAAPDMDRDGRPEAIAFGIDPANETVLAVLESPCNDSFVPVWVAHPEGWYGLGWDVEVGDLDGDGISEFAVATGAQVLLYRCIGNDQYETFWSRRTQYFCVGLVDIDRDGRDELLLDSAAHTVIFKYVLTGQAELRQRELERVHAVPSIVRAGAAAWLRPLESGVNVQVLSADGRVLVEDRSRIADVRRLRPGAYFVRLTSGSASVTRKVLVVP